MFQNIMRCKIYLLVSIIIACSISLYAQTDEELRLEKYNNFQRRIEEAHDVDQLNAIIEEVTNNNEIDNNQDLRDLAYGKIKKIEGDLRVEKYNKFQKRIEDALDVDELKAIIEEVTNNNEIDNNQDLRDLAYGKIDEIQNDDRIVKYNNFKKRIENAKNVDELNAIISEVTNNSEIDNNQILRDLANKKIEDIKTEKTTDSADSSDTAKTSSDDDSTDIPPSNGDSEENNNEETTSTKTDKPANTEEIDNSDENLADIPGISSISSSTGGSKISICIPGMGAINIQSTGAISLNISISGGSMKIQITDGQSVAQTSIDEITDDYPEPEVSTPISDSQKTSGISDSTDDINYENGVAKPVKGITVAPKNTGDSSEEEIGNSFFE